MPFSPMNPNDPNGRAAINRATHGGIPLQKAKEVPVFPWDAFVKCALHVYRDGKVQLALFDPQPMETAEEAFQTMRLINAAQLKKPGPIAWETVPECVQRHFKFEDDQPAIETG